MAYNRSQGGAYTLDEQNALLGNPFDVAHQISASGAIDPHTPGRYIITKASAAAMTLGAPVAGIEDGLCITVMSSTAAAHTITATGLLLTASASVNVATMAAQAGCQVIMTAF